MSNIYKFHHVIGDNIKKTYVFNDKTSKNSKTKDIPIYNDDMIINIKHKLSSLFDNQSHHEIYMFCKSKDILNQTVYYQILTQDDNIKLTTDIYKRFVSNIAIENNFLKKPNTIATKQLTSFYKNKQLWNKQHNVITPIGVNAFHRRKYIFHHNPYACNKQDDYISSDIKKFISTENKKLLFKYKPENNEIYFCFADELLRFINQSKQNNNNNNISEDYLIQLYFPSLFNQNISSLSDIESFKVKLKSDSTKEYNQVFKDYNKNVDLLHRYSNTLKDQLNYHINSIYFTIHPMETLQLPLEVIFKKINSSQLLPLVKYNPGKDLESIYRLYTNDYISNKGLKIPSLYVENNENSRKIKQIASNILYTNRIGFYLDLKHLKTPIDEELYCILLDNGDIQVKLKLSNNIKYDIHQLEKTFHPIIKTHIINVINTFVQKKSIYHFESLKDNNVELNNIDVVYSTDYTDTLSFQNLKCTSSVFSVINKNKKKNQYDLTYKRVSFYQKMNDIQSFINTKLQEAISIEEIKQLVMSNFNITEEKAVEIMDGFLKEIRLATDAFENRKIKVEDNPGFNIHIETKNIDYVNVKLQRLFEIKNINDVTYLSDDIIKQYLMSLININQLDEPLKECTKKIKEKKIEEIKEIYENPLEDAKIGFDSDDDDDDMFDLMSGFEEEEKSKETSKSKSKETSKSKSKDDESIDLNDIDIQDDEEEDEDNDDSISIGLDSLTGNLEDESPSISLSGGNKAQLDLTSIKLKGSKNWFTNRLRKRQPDIFVMSKEDEKNKNYVKYSKSCQWQYKKQPIILNDDELKKIDKADKSSNSKSYDGHINYNGYNYICPRYWCFKDDDGTSRSISFKQINEGECGGWDAVNPKEAKSLLPNKRIVELTDDRMHNPSKSNNPLVYKPLYPFLQKSENHPKGFCAPCCSQVPLENEGFPDESKSSRDEKKKGQQLYFEHLYNPGNTKGTIVVDKTFENDKQVNEFVKQWEGLGPSFKITKKGKHVKIIDIGKQDKSVSKLNKIDLIPKNKNTPENPTREDIDKILARTKNNKRFNTCTNKTQQTQQTTPSSDKKGKKSTTIKKKRKTKKSKTLNSLSLLKRDVDDEATITKDPTPITNFTQQLKTQQLKTQQQQKTQQQPQPRKTVVKKKVKPFLFEFPLKTPNTFGYLKPSLQKFIQYDTTSICYNNPPNDSSLKPNAKCLLRLGVKKNSKQSFVEAIAAIQNKSLSQFKSHLSKKITISKFIIAFKGQLIDLFYDSNKKVDTKTKKQIIKSIDENIINDFILMEHVGEKLINAYINFIAYLKDDTILINYSYLWDFISKPTDKNNAGVVFKNGINLVIFNAPQDDITDKIEIICPKHTFTNEIFSEFKQTIMMYKEGSYFEPIVLYNNETDITQVLFDYTTLVSETMLNTLFTDIKNKMVEGCSLKPSIPDKYDYRRNVSAKKVIETLLTIDKTSIVKQVVHYNYNTVGIIAQVNKSSVYIPCHPSPIIIDMDYEYYDSPSILFDAVETFNTLTILAKTHKLPCLPIKILLTDKTNITGFITETNQVVPTKQFDYDAELFVMKSRNGKVIPKHKSIIDIKENNEYFSDKEVMKKSIEDIQRIVTVRNFLLEKNFYNCYRNTFKMHIGKENNGNLRQNLIDLLDTTVKQKTADTLKQYNVKFNQVKKIVDKIITEKVVEFAIYKSTILNELYKKVKEGINICMSNKKANIMPLKNLIDKSNNKERYATKLIDELIRYPRLRDYMLYNKSTTSIDIINYSTTKNEIIILEEEMFNNYLTDVTLESKNKYINTNQLGFTKPIVSKTYKTRFDINYKTYAEPDEEKISNIKLTYYTPKDPITAPTDIDKYVSNNVKDTSRLCVPTFNTNKNIIAKFFNNYNLNTYLNYHKIIAPRIEDTKGGVKENCTWNIVQEMYKDYYNTSITKMDLCKTLVYILKSIHDDKMFVTKPGAVKDIFNYSKILEITRRTEGLRDWSRIEEVEDSQWSHLFTIVSNKDYYITEFELYLLCEYFKIPCVIHGTVEKKEPLSIYKKSKIQYYDPLYTTFNTHYLGKKPSDKDIKQIKNNLYTNKNKETFCYVVGYIQIRLSDYYNKAGVKNNQGLNKYLSKEYRIPFDVGLMKTPDDSFKIELSNEYMKSLLKHSITPSIKQYTELIFKSTSDSTKDKTTIPTIYESFKNEVELFRKTKRNKGKKEKLILKLK